MNDAAEALPAVQPAHQALAPAELQQVGLSPADMPEVLALSETLSNPTSTAIHAYGRDATARTSQYADRILEEARTKDLEDTGKRLNQVVTLARKVNPARLATSSKLPVIGGIINAIRDRTDRAVATYRTTASQVDLMVTEVQATQTGLKERSLMLEEMGEHVRNDYHSLGLHVAAGRLALQRLKTRRAEMAGAGDQSPLVLQDLAEMEGAIEMLDKRVADLAVVQQATLQALPTIALIRAQNLSLVDKFENLKELTVPMWKREFAIVLAMKEAERGIQLAQKIDDTTNEVMIRSAELLHSNATATARANSRLVVDVETLRKTHDMLIRTIDDVRKINSEGVAKREQAVLQLQDLRGKLQMRLASESAPKQLTQQ